MKKLPMKTLESDQFLKTTSKQTLNTSKNQQRFRV
jgi:hypothetical protein